MKQGTANLAEDYCFIHKTLRPVSKARRKIAAVPPSNSRPVICYPRTGYVTTKVHVTSTADATILRYFQTERFSCFLPSVYAGHVNLAKAKHCHWVGGSCQSSEMATLLNSLSFVFKMLFLPKHLVMNILRLYG